MMRASPLCVVVLLAGCLSQPRTPEPALYDLGMTAAGNATLVKTNAVPAAVRVRASARSWLDHTAMHYRLVYVDGMRTLTYAYARWIAPPAELVGQRLRQRLAESGAAAGIGSARELDLELEEYVQVFETPAQSFGRVSVHARLSGSSTEEASFTEQVAAQTPDAAGGVRALVAATDALIARIVEWIGARGDQEAGTNLGGARPATK
jgi:cholesterol transport system auxiliary component